MELTDLTKPQLLELLEQYEQYIQNYINEKLFSLRKINHEY